MVLLGRLRLASGRRDSINQAHTTETFDEMQDHRRPIQLGRNYCWITAVRFHELDIMPKIIED